jgi:glutathione synthase/RimK-type ligase-like ATP-grasp enzyme
MWHFHHLDLADMLVARSVLTAAELMGLRVFPDYRTNWHFDDKLSQKYVLEALQLPCPSAWAFFDKERALEFVRGCQLPLVAKLRHGAGSYNVRLLTSRRKAEAYVQKMFGRGLCPVPAPLADVRTKLRVAANRGGLGGVWNRLKKAPNFARVVLQGRKNFGREKGYVYFQKFIPGNACDYRLMVVGDMCWGYRRMIRSGDFRASGSHVEDNDPTRIPPQMIRAAFHAADRLRMQSAGFDFVMEGDQPLILEVSGFYGLDPGNYDVFWDRDLVRHDVLVDPRVRIIEDLLSKLKQSSAWVKS